MYNLGEEFQKKYRVLSILDQKEIYSIYEVEEISSGRCFLAKHYRSNIFWQSMSSLKQKVEQLAAEESEFIPNIYDVEEEHKELYVIVEKLEGFTLNDLISQEDKFDVVWVLKLMKKFVEGIQFFSKKSVPMHLINPKNIMINYSENSDDVSIKFTEMFSGEYVEDKGTDNMLEQAIYMAPEQVGISRKKVDVRADLYSIGVIAYQLLAGRLPFRAKTLNQYMYQQVAQVPIAVSRFNPEVNKSLESMIMCLLEKDPANRYQSAEGLLYDIREYLSGNVNFEKNSYDSISKIRFWERDFLPKKEMDYLESLLDKCKGFVAISGEKNTGKSVVIGLIKVVAENPKNTLLYSDCGYRSFGIDILWNLLRDYLKVFVNYPLRRQDILRKELWQSQNVSKEAVCTFGKEFEILFSPEMPEYKTDIFESLCSIWNAVGKIEDHLVILLERISMDEHGYDMMRKFYQSTENTLLCIASRERAHDIEGIDLYFYLKKLTDSDILETLNRITHHRMEDPKEMANYLLRRSQGNIYLVTEVINWLFTKEALVYREGKWRANPLILFELGLPGEVAAEIIGRSDRLSSEAKHLLMIMASFDMQSPWTYVKKVAMMEKLDIELILNELIQEQFIESKIKDTLYYSFTDAEIYRHFRKQLGKSQIEYYCEKMAEVLEAEYLRFGKEEEAVEMTKYYLFAKNNEKIKKYALKAAEFLKIQGKYQQALDVLSGFLNALEYQDDEIELFYYAQKMAGEIYIIEGKLQEAEHNFESLLKLDLNKEMRCDILQERAWVSFYKGNFKESFECVKTLLKERKIYLPTGTPTLFLSLSVQIVIRWIQGLLGDPDRYTKEFGQDYSKDINNIWWVSMMVDARYFTYLSLKHANENWKKRSSARNLAVSYFGLAQVFMGTSLKKLTNKYLEKAMQITAEIGDDNLSMMAYMLLAYRSEMEGDYETQLNYALMALQLHKKLQFSPFYGMSMNALIHAYMYLGDFNNMLRYNEFYQKRAYDTGDNYGIISSYIYFLQYFRGQGDMQNAIQSGKKALEIALQTEDYFDQFCSYAELGATYFYDNEYDLAIESFEHALEIKKGRSFPTQYTSILYPYYAMSLCHKQKKIKEDFPEDKSLYSSIRKLLQIAIREVHYPTYYGISLWAKAEWHAFLREKEEARKYFRKSIDHNIKIRRMWPAAVIQMAYGNYLAEIGELTAAMQEYALAEYNFRNLRLDSFIVLVKRAMKQLATGGETGEMDNDLDKFQRRIYQERNTQMFTELVRDLSSVLDYKELIQKMIMVLLEASGAQQIAVFLPTEKGDFEVEEFYTNETLKIKTKQEMVKEIPMNLVRMVEKTKEFLVLSNAEKSEYTKLDEILAEKHMKSILILPVIYKKSMKAICYLENSLSTDIFSDDVVENLKVIAAQMAVSMENAMLYKIATTDDLTGLYTRKHFDYFFQEELKLAKETSAPLGVVFIDIDKFKSVNDTYGHMVGDQVLVGLSKFLKNNCRATDVIGRFGGEEIILLLRGTTAQESYQFAERLRQKLEKYVMDVDTGKLSITASFGISAYPDHGDSVGELISKADTALYRSKNEGRNRVSICK